MNEASNLSQAALTADAYQEPKIVCMSLVSNTREKQPRIIDCEVEEVIEMLRDGTGGIRAKIERIRERFWKVMEVTKGDRKAAKKAVNEIKLSLPALMPSGTFTGREDDTLTQHSGLLCIDIDGLGREKLAEVKAKLRKSAHVYALFDSPTQDGVKAFCRVPADGEKHLASFFALRKHVLEITGAKIDKSCKNVGRLCFLSYDPEIYVNEEAAEITPIAESDEEEPPRRQEIAPGDPRLETRRRIANEMLGDINWYNETQGYITCPGEEEHHTPTEDTHCRVHLDGAPNIFCFHDSCTQTREEANRKLRSLILRAERFPRNDTERALRFVDHFGSDLRYVEAWDQWLVWTGTRWIRDSEGIVFRKAQQMSNILLDEVKTIEDEDRRKTAAGIAIAAGNEAKIKSMLNVARYQVGIVASPQTFDSNPYLIGVTNGVVDLRTGTFRSAAKEDYITKQLNAAYDLNATCPTWDRFLLRVLNDDLELVSFIHRAVGYSLSGDVSEQCLFFLYGMGHNGKSTFADLLELFFSDYGLKSTSSLYTLDKHGNEPLTEIARLVGKRFVTGSETEEGAKLAESRVKDITGGDTMTGRELYCPAFNFRPSHKLWIYGNHRPDIRGNDHGIWRRIKLIPFAVKITDEEKDGALPEKLAAELPGILNWAIKGYSEWRRVGLGTPKVVVDATAEYREEEDELGEFISETCLLEGRIERKVLYDAFKAWVTSRGIKFPMTQKAFAKRLHVRGIEGDKTNGIRIWIGIALRPEVELTAEHRLIHQFTPSLP